MEMDLTGWSLSGFCGSIDDGPWVPGSIRLDAQRDSSLSGTSAYRSSVPAAFSGWRGSLFSDCNAVPLPSDSGYESLPKRSVENASVSGDGDRKQDVRPATVPLGEYHSFGSLPPEALLSDAKVQKERRKNQWNHEIGQQFSVLPNVVRKARFICPECDQAVKTKAELK